MTRTERSFSFLGTTIRASGAVPEPIEWLGEFLSPWFEVGEAAPPEIEVELAIDPRRADALLAEGAERADRQVETFVRDGESRPSPAWADERGSLTVLLPEKGSAYRIAAAGGRIEIVAPSGAGRHRIALLRAVREIAIAAARDADRVLLHAAAFTDGDRVVAVAGPRRTGKTTFLLHALADPRRALVTNDRLFVRLDGGGVSARGVPTIVSLREGTLAMRPVLARRLAGSGFHWSRSLAEAARAETPSPGSGISPLQLCRALEVEPAAEGRLAAILFPRPGDGDEARVERLGLEDAASAIASSLFGGSGPWPTAPLWLGAARAPRPSAAETRALCRAIAERVPVHAAVVGPDRLADAARLTELVETLRR